MCMAAELGKARAAVAAGGAGGMHGGGGLGTVPEGAPPKPAPVPEPELEPAPEPKPQPQPQQWRRHFVGDRELWRWTGTNPATEQWYSKAEKDASIRFDAPTAAEGVVVLPDKDESDSPANRAWFDTHWKPVAAAQRCLHHACGPGERYDPLGHFKKPFAFPTYQGIRVNMMPLVAPADHLRFRSDDLR